MARWPKLLTRRASDVEEGESHPLSPAAPHSNCRPVLAPVGRFWQCCAPDWSSFHAPPCPSVVPQLEPRGSLRIVICATDWPPPWLTSAGFCLSHCLSHSHSLLALPGQASCQHPSSPVLLHSLQFQACPVVLLCWVLDPSTRSCLLLLFFLLSSRTGSPQPRQHLFTSRPA